MSRSDDVRYNALETITEEIESLASVGRSMMERENSLLVPAIAEIVPESEQKTFNNKVLMNLGLWDSRMHLVGMHEAVQECDDPLERKLFEQAIPSIPRMMIPRWKRKLYEPHTSVLDL